MLATESPFKKRQFAQLGLPFSCCAPQVDESAQTGENGLMLSVRLAEAKAQAAKSLYPDELIIGSDQVACLTQHEHETLLQKPLNRDVALWQLQQCSAKTVYFYSSVCVANHTKLETRTAITEVRFRELSTNEIERYVDTEDVLNCAGSFRCEALGISLFDCIRSDDPSALIGLPLILLNKMLISQGINTLNRL